jgi:hypothetical protein
MSVYGMTLTVLANELIEAVRKDELPESGGFDISAGLIGENLSEWLRTVAETVSNEKRPEGTSNMIEVPLIAIRVVSNGFIVADHSDSIMNEIPAHVYIADTIDDVCTHVKNILLNQGDAEQMHAMQLHDIVRTDKEPSLIEQFWKDNE